MDEATTTSTRSHPELRHRQRQILQRIWREGPLSRQDLHRRLRAHANLVGQDVGELVAAGLLREGSASAVGRGRPGIPLQIDPRRRRVLGLALTPGAVHLTRLALDGRPAAPARTIRVARADRLVPAAARLLGAARDARVLSIGVTATGLLDESAGELLLSSSVPGHSAVSLLPIVRAAGACPIVLRNDMHALAARWLLGPSRMQDEDVLIVSLTDGRIGSAMLIDGHVNRGCLLGANELGHTRFPVRTPACYCGRQGCLERIFSSAFLGAGVSSDEGLGGALAAPRPSARARRILELTAHGIANAVNFVRPHRLVLTGVLGADPRVFAHLLAAVRDKILAGMVDRVRIEPWMPPATGAGETAAWLAIAAWFLPRAAQDKIDGAPRPDPADR